MAFKLENPAEAYAAVSLLVVGADGVGSLQERQFLFEKLGEADVFAGQDAESLGGLLGTLTGRMFAELPNDGVALSPEAFALCCQGARELLNETQCGELYSLAVELACCDGLDDTERLALSHIAGSLGLDAAAAREELDRVASAG